MSINYYLVASIILSIVAVAVAVISYFDGKKRTKLLETMSKALPHTTKRSTKSGTSSSKKSLKSSIRANSNSIELRQMKQDLEREKFQWRKNKDIAKGIAWMIDHFDTEDEEE